LIAKKEEIKVSIEESHKLKAKYAEDLRKAEIDNRGLI